MFLSHDEYLENIDGLAGLFLKSFGRGIRKDFLKWRYVDNPTKEIFVNIIKDENRIIANYSASPCQLSINGIARKSALSMTTMTDPEFAGRGLFQKLAEELYDSLQEKGYSAVWGFPNNQSHKTFNTKLKWQDIYEIPTMSLRVNMSKDLKPSGSVVYDNGFLLEYSPVVSIKDLIHVVKDQTYLQWRYLRNPINAYVNIVVKNGEKASSYCVVKKYNMELDLVDFQASDAEQGIELIRSVIEYAKEQHLEKINCWAPRHHFMHGICERHGFANGEPITYLGVRSFGAFELSCDYSDWFIQMGDSDVY